MIKENKNRKTSKFCALFSKYAHDIKKTKAQAQKKVYTEFAFGNLALGRASITLEKRNEKVFASPVFCFDVAIYLCRRQTDFR
jgi:hypothetical protein